ncbi:adenylate/guanylate cyclase domain-containing protein [Exilibacterium tricleocarpae]|nr:adenylate/guanylate cyclase domain-containing protein [Exilibacterium tricleocarpae]
MNSQADLIESLTAELLSWQKNPPPREQMRTQLSSLIQSNRTQHHRPENRYVTVMMADIRGFNDLTASYPPETVVALLNQCFTVAADIIVRHEGVVDKFVGDGIVAIFGLDPALGGGADQGIAAAVALQQSMPAINRYSQQLGTPPVHIGIGLNTGEVIAADIGSSVHREYTVIGEQVNLTARIAAHSLRGQILLSQATWQQAQNFIEAGPPNTVHLNGRREPLTIYELKETRKPTHRQVPRIEERKGPRVHVKIPLAFQRIEGAAVLPEYHQGEIIELGYHGMKVRIPLYLEPNSDIRFPLSMAQADASSTEIYARVLRTKMASSDYTSSLEFTSIAPGGQAALRAFIDHLVA